MMNERVTELAMSIQRDRHWTEKDIEKFAELILRECITQINEAIPDTDCSASGAYKTAKIAAMTRVKDHFGVE